MGAWITSFINSIPHEVYGEPFGGAASILLRKDPVQYEVYNDLDQNLVNLFRVLRDESEELIRKLESTPYSRVEHRNAFDSSNDPVENARRLIVRYRLSFGRVEPAKFKTPQSAAFKWRFHKGRPPTRDWETYLPQLQAAAYRLRQVLLESVPAADFMRMYDGPDTLFYVDPPYLGRKKNNQYLFEMGEQDHKELIEVLKGLKARIILSGYDHPAYNPLKEMGWQIQTKTALDSARNHRQEVLWMSPNCKAMAAMFE